MFYRENITNEKETKLAKTMLHVITVKLKIELT
jgi:hypothetical protein